MKARLILGYAERVPEEELTLGHHERHCDEPAVCQWYSNLNMWGVFSKNGNEVAFVCRKCKLVWVR